MLLTVIKVLLYASPQPPVSVCQDQMLIQRGTVPYRTICEMTTQDTGTIELFQKTTVKPR